MSEDDGVGGGSRVRGSWAAPRLPSPRSHGQCARDPPTALLQQAPTIVTQPATSDAARTMTTTTLRGASRSGGATPSGSTGGVDGPDQTPSSPAMVVRLRGGG